MPLNCIFCLLHGLLNASLTNVEPTYSAYHCGISRLQLISRTIVTLLQKPFFVKYWWRLLDHPEHHLERWCSAPTGCNLLGQMFLEYFVVFLTFSYNLVILTIYNIHYLLCLCRLFQFHGSHWRHHLRRQGMDLSTHSSQNARPY